MKTILSILILIIFFGCSESDTTAEDSKESLVQDRSQRSSLVSSEAAGTFTSTTVKLEKYAEKKEKEYWYLDLANVSWWYPDTTFNKDSIRVRRTRVFSTDGEDYTLDMGVWDFNKIITDHGFTWIWATYALYEEERFNDVWVLGDSWVSFYPLGRKGVTEPLTNVLFKGTYGTDNEEGDYYRIVFQIDADSLYNISIR